MSNATGGRPLSTRTANLLLVLGSICFTLALAEAVLQIGRFGNPIRYSVWPPGLEQVVSPTAQGTPGIEPQSHLFSITPMGYRGRPIGHAGLRIAAFGGSTTESLFVPERRSWPSLVEQGLAKERGAPVWVGNFGKSGRNTRQHILDAKYVLPQFSAHVALFLVGVNDLGLSVITPGTQPMSLAEIQSDAYVRKSLELRDVDGPRVRLPGLIEAAYRSANEWLTDSDAPRELPHFTTAFYEHYRKLRAARAGFSAQMPDLGPLLAEYTQNLTAIADLVASQVVLPVFISQPTLWSSKVPPEIEALFWWGAVGGPPSRGGALYYSPDVLDRMMGLYNESLRLVARQKNVPLIDAAERLPRNTTYFYDEMHYNEAGSRVLAELIVRELTAVLQQRRPAGGAGPS